MFLTVYGTEWSGYGAGVPLRNYSLTHSLTHSLTQCRWLYQVMTRFVFGEMTLDQTFLCDTLIGKYYTPTK